MSATVELIDVRVRAALQRLSERWRESGVELIVFGSFANGEAGRYSDLDLAYRRPGAKDEKPDDLGHGVAAWKRELEREVERLPTIRPIDLVDLERCGAELRESVEAQGVVLCEWLGGAPVREAGGRRPEARGPETGSRRPEAGDQKPETRELRAETYER